MSKHTKEKAEASHEAFGLWIKARREELKLSQTTVGGALDMTQSQIAKWERGEMRSLTPWQIRGLAHVLQLSAAEVAHRFGYPVAPDGVSLPTPAPSVLNDQVALVDHIAELYDRLVELTHENRERPERNAGQA